MVAASHNRRSDSQVSPAQRGCDQGFTLIEMMLAIVIFAIVLSAIHMVFYGAIQLRNKTTEALERALPINQTLTIIQRDLANIVMPGGTLFGQLQTSQTSAATNALDSLSPMNDSIPGQSSPAFYTASGIIQDNSPWSEVERVSYSLVAPTNATPGKDLVRTVTRNLLPTLIDQPEVQTLMSGVETIHFSFYDGLQWREYWDSTTETNKLPLGIKVELELTRDNADRSPRAPIELVVPVILQPGTNEVAQTSGGDQ
jgi:general secretion pathway protein J